MDRNFFQRVEVAFPVSEKTLKRRLIADLDIYLNDNTNSWDLQPAGNYLRTTRSPDAEPYTAQDSLLDLLAEDVAKLPLKD